MNWLEPAIIATFCNSFILFLVYFYLYFKERIQSLKVFAFSWAIYAARYIFMLLYVYYEHPLLLLANQLTVFISVFLLLYGFILWRGKTGMPSAWIVTGSITVIWIIATHFMRLNFMLYTLPTFMVTGIIYITCAVLLLRDKTISGTGKRAVGVILIIWGLHKMDYPFLRTVDWFAPIGYLIGAVCAVLTAIGIILIYFDKAKKELHASLNEKNILLREVNHRVKNNLNVVLSLVQFQTLRSHRPEMQDVLIKLKNRIFAIALIHSQLHKQKDIYNIDFKTYLRELITYILTSLGEDSHIVSMNLPGEEIPLTIDQAKTLGLIINEGITNSIKHAFDSNGADKHIEISFFLRNGFYELVIRDNGKGITAKPGDNGNSGLFLMEQLCEELDGELSVRNDRGTVICITFPGENNEHTAG